MQKSSPKILREHNLRITECRSQVLKLFMERLNALSNADVEGILRDTFDRVTIYRTLKTFLEKGIIHKVLDDTGILKYALCKDQCHKDSHNHQHVHFKCKHCGQTTCLEEVKIPHISLPKGFIQIDSNLLISGICGECEVLP